METLRIEWLGLVLNAFLIAATLSIPILVGILILRIMRRGISADRKVLEEEVNSQLDAITATQIGIINQLQGSSEQPA